MHVISYTEARKNLKSELDRVVDDADATLITRRHGGDVVLLSRADYDGLMETLHLLSTEANRKHLKESIEQYRSGTVIQRELLE